MHERKQIEIRIIAFKHGVLIHFRKEIKANSMLLLSTKLGGMGSCEEREDFGSTNCPSVNGAACLLRCSHRVRRRNSSFLYEARPAGLYSFFPL